MRIIKKLVIALIVLIVVLAGVGAILPSAYRVERSATIAAPAEVVFEQVNNLKKNESWSPWMKNDPTIKVSYSGPDAGVGAVSSWTSEHSGNGSQTIKESVPNQSLTTYLDFGKMGNANGIWTFSQEGEATKVTQAMVGDQGKNPFKHLMNLAMDKMMGKYFEQGLNSLKEVSEKRAAEVKAEQAATQQAAAAPAEEPAAATAAAPVAKKP
jgi:ribosome-associated toxin RatA of RatAB toxin-antitoxin module